MSRSKFIAARGSAKRALNCIIAIGLLAIAVETLSRPHGSAPPFGAFFSPFGGAWGGSWGVFGGVFGGVWGGSTGSAARGGLWASGDRTLNIPGLAGRVIVRADREGVKRIFAESDDDLYFAQGFVTASDRLWQMDFLYRLAAGRLAEIVGARGVEFDKLFRKFGIPLAAEESAELALQDPATKAPLTRYAEGVNAYIKTVRPADYPFEYKLLNYAPEAWSPKHAAYLMKFMAFNLAAHSRDLPLTRSQSRVSQADFDDLFPLDMPIPEPIIPKSAKWNFPRLAGNPPKSAQTFRASISALEPMPTPHPSNGSNNWAVAGKKSTTGRPILSNDIHLDYSLPSLWYEIQLSSPTQNVYGASLPGTPGVVLGFNRDLAWAVTNGGSDVLDWYELRFRDEKRHEYLHEGEWRPVVAEESIITVKGEEPIKLTLKRTHYGPIVYDATEIPVFPWVPRGLAMRWGPLGASNEIKSFLSINKAHGIDDCHAAISTFNWPDQNFLCADSKNIGLWHNGQYPIRWKGQGRTIADGSSRDFDWSGWIPRDQVPGSVNPERGFLSSANQAPTDSGYPHYLGWPFEEPYRGERINEILRSREKFTPRDLIEMQGDTEQKLAVDLLPSLIKALPADRLDARERQAAALLKLWNCRFDETSVAASIWQNWWIKLQDAIWSEKFPDPKTHLYPPAWRTAQLILSDPHGRHFDQLSTPERETFEVRALASFHDTITELSTKNGSDFSKWTLAQLRPTVIQHAARIPGLGSGPLSVRGDQFSIYANTGSHGPVWKLVVALGSRDAPPKAWAIYPGGQSGDPASPLYDEFVDRWTKNELREISFLLDAKSPLPNEVGLTRMESQ